jgi:hypothetical protein
VAKREMAPVRHLRRAPQNFLLCGDHPIRCNLVTP